MKALKSFLITLAVVVALGGAVLLGKGAAGGNMSASMIGKAAKTETTAKSDKAAKKPRKVNPVTKAVVGKVIDGYLDSVTLADLLNGTIPMEP